MTTMTLRQDFTPPDLRRMLTDAPLFSGAGAMILLLILPTLAALAIDPRLFHGENVWLKPLKFELALALHLFSLAFFARLLPGGFTARRTHRIYAAIVVICIVVEITWISGAAMFGVASHFNDTSPVMAAIYPVMGVLAVTLTSPAIVYGVAILRKGARTDFELASGIGLCLTFLLTIPIAGYMAGSDGHFVGTPGAADARMWLTGWSRTVGDLRVPHFFATHAMQILPASVLLLALGLPAGWMRPVVWTLPVAYVAFVGLVFVEALRGLPFLPVW